MILIRIVCVFLILLESKNSVISASHRDDDQEKRCPVDMKVPKSIITSNNEWNPTRPFLPNEKAEEVELCEYFNNNQLIFMEEDNKNVAIAFLNYKGSTQPTVEFRPSSSASNESLGLVFMKLSSNEFWQMVVTIQQDYERLPGARKYEFEVKVGSAKHTVYLQIVNIDNKSPIIQPDGSCYIEENMPGLSTCSFTITDADGIMKNYVRYDIIGQNNAENIFEMKNENEIQNGIYEWKAFLNIRECLDFETIALYILDINVTDSGGNVGPVRVIVNVIDMPDEPPVWKQVFATQQFDEKQAMTFEVKAVDGDVMVNYTINYELYTDWEELFEIEQETGIIHVAPIDRDFLNREIFTFDIKAYEVPYPKWHIIQPITIIVNDINDHEPKIDVAPNSISIPENYASKLEFQVVIVDEDLGDNGRYSVSLKDDSSNEYNSAFQIVPEEGYQRSEFTITVIKSFLLDYEIEAWQNITVDISAIEVQNNTHKDIKSIKIYLDNLNDELPMFEKESYKIEFLENITINTFVEKVYAHDRDIGDKVTHSILGLLTSRFSINAVTGQIYTNVSKALDYEKEKIVTIQVQAEDSLCCVRHRNVTHLEIHVLDVNDKPPEITVPTTALQLEENRAHGFIINENFEITARDPDTQSKLKFYINWTESYATINGQILKEENHKYYLKSVEVETVKLEPAGDGDFVKAVLRINEIIEKNTPDYERFHRLYISLIVEDEDQIIEPKTDKALIMVEILDLNDNYPIFDETSLQYWKRVVENSTKDTYIATVFAADADGPEHNKIEYQIESNDELVPKNWIRIDSERGEMYVNVDKEIDADGNTIEGLPAIWTLNYTVIALNNELRNRTKISIEVVDINDNRPIIVTMLSVVPVKEQSKSDTNVQTIKTKDADRDAPNNTPWFHLGNSADDEMREFFSVDRTTGRVFVFYKGSKVLDRDYGTQGFTIPITYGDNYGDNGGNQFTNDTTFMVVLKDINNREPIIVKDSEVVKTTEDKKKGENIGTVIAEDDDQEGTPNTMINFTILNIRTIEGPVADLPTHLFTISTDSDFRTGRGNLTTQYDLKGYYGIFNITIMTNDFGEDPGPLSNTKDVSVYVEKYNFKPPKITYPSEDTSYYLGEEQSKDMPLLQMNGEPVPVFAATDQSGTEKWDIEFRIDEESNVGDAFKMAKFGRSQYRLQKNNDITQKDYRLKIIADCKCVGAAVSTTTITVDLIFIDNDYQPFFDEPKITNVEFTENSTGLGERASLPLACWFKGNCDLDDIYYSIREDSTQGRFKIEEKEPILELIQELDREIEAQHTLKIVSSRSSNIPGTPNENSILTVLVKVLDVNDNPPNFHSSAYFEAIKPSDSVGKTILTVVAHDLDINDTLLLEMVEGSFVANGNELQKIQTPFSFMQDPPTTSSQGVHSSYQVILQFNPTSNMIGNFEFNIRVSDGLHSDETSVKIFVVSDDSKIKYLFLNPLETVQAKKDVIKGIFEEHFEYDCVIGNIMHNTNENAFALYDETVVEAHFIDRKTLEPIANDLMSAKSADSELFTKLRKSFSEEGLTLENLQTPEVAKNLENLYRNLLIGVGVTLGVLMIFLVIVFAVKIKQLNQRVKNLSSTSVSGSKELDISGMVPAAPNTNKHALLGSNPVYSESPKMQLDNMSVGSGDSDLIGIEENPNFHNNASNGKTTQSSNA